ncbi:MAG: AsnC family transcriptional regulator [ANME-2 cluster archaeon]|nr:AsnC family transcriptional regulator [ANME-2 cluster archaeon]MCL7475361.1 AsnC family transcriptional regulator [ANME-2 cluster archaeon]MDF1531136.1 AsnC family transcriptional regulator [ANME-2 cluster archaeon]MDW7777184.1 AsnC family transcriptional regulator [Methanosarcinales archaeon]
MDEIDTQLLKTIQDGIPITSRPFKKVARQLGISEIQVLERIGKLHHDGIIRRFGASVGHRAIGFTANAMCTWNVPDSRVEDVGAIMAGFSEVTHCYERPRRDGWPYNLFTMVHAYTRDECRKVAKQISNATGIEDYNILFSEKEFKKTGVRL